MGSFHGRVQLDPARDEEFARLYREGLTCAEIGKRFDRTASGVSYVLRRMGVTHDPVARAAVIARRHGVLLNDFESAAQMRKALKGFLDQRSAAAYRHIEWELTFSQWWAIWRESGRWESRGRSGGDSAVMARDGDVGPYSVGNVRITTLADNFVESWRSAPNRFSHRRSPI